MSYHSQSHSQKPGFEFLHHPVRSFWYPYRSLFCFRLLTRFLHTILHLAHLFCLPNLSAWQLPSQRPSAVDRWLSLRLPKGNLPVFSVFHLAWPQLEAGCHLSDRWSEYANLSSDADFQIGILAGQLKYHQLEYHLHGRMSAHKPIISMHIFKWKYSSRVDS